MSLLWNSFGTKVFDGGLVHETNGELIVCGAPQLKIPALCVDANEPTTCLACIVTMPVGVLRHAMNPCAEIPLERDDGDGWSDGGGGGLGG